jgi:hypothetical protein
MYTPNLYMIRQQERLERYTQNACLVALLALVSVVSGTITAYVLG